METSIGYLKTVHGDLLVAARSEAIRGAAPNGHRGPRRRRFSTTSFATAAAVIVLVAGIIGALVRSGGFGVEEAAVPGSGGGAAGATGAAGAGEDAQTIRGPGVGYDEVHPGELSVPSDFRAPFDPAISRIIRTAQISIIVPRDTFDVRFAAVVDAAEDSRGFVAVSSSKERAGTLSLRVPSALFDETLDAIRDLGRVAVESVRGQDVTGQYVDLRARLRIERSRREVLLRLMDRAVSIEQTIHVRNALDETQLRIEQLQGQLRLLNDQTSFAMITVHLREEGVAAEVEPASIPNAFERAGAGFVGVIAAIIIGIGYLLPLVAIGLVIWFVVVQVRRRRREA